MVTIKDLAARLGVSPSTITRALADSPRISAKTKNLVRNAAEEMGYTADKAAKTMRSRESTLIGLIVPDIENSFYAQIAKAISEVCNQNGFQLMLAVSDDRPDVEEKHIQELFSARCAGIAIVPSPQLSAKSMSFLGKMNVGQLIRRETELSTDWYGVKEDEAIARAVSCLINLNHRRIGLICGSDEITSGQDRIRGYSSALAQGGIDVDPALIKRGAPRMEFGQSAAAQLSHSDLGATAIIAAGAALSEGMLNTAATWSPETQTKLSLIGYSDCPAFRWWGKSGLTTVDLPIHKMASDMCSNLIRRSKSNRDANPNAEDHHYDTNLILRGSVRPPSATR